MFYFHEVQIFMNAALNLALAEIQDPELMHAKIYRSFVVCVMQLATMCDGSAYD